MLTMLNPEQRNVLQALHDAGQLTPSAVIGEARKPESLLHPLFDWDDASAAEAYRLDQARTVIRSVHVVVRSKTDIIRVVRYVRDPDAGREQGYVTLESVTNETRQRRVIIQEINRALGNLRRASDITRALGWDSPVEKYISEIMLWRNDLEDGIAEAEGNGPMTTTAAD